MLRATLSKIKRVCSIAFIPRILQGDVKYASQKKFTKHFMVTSQATKSTSSNSGTTESKESSGNDKIQEKSHQNVEKCAERNLAEERERCDRIISKIFPPGDPLYASPTDREGLEQKLEHLNEVPVTGNAVLDDRSSNVLEQQETDTSNLYYEPERNNYDNRFDDVANRCLTTPPKHVDEQLLKELGAKYIPDHVDFYPKKPTQSYYSQILYEKAQVIRFHKDAPKPNETRKIELISDAQVEKASKAESIQPLVLDSVSLYGRINKGSKDVEFDALEDTQLSPVMNPYASQSYPFHNYAFEEDMLEHPVEEESITITTGVNDGGNNNLIPPNEMEIESDKHSVREKVEGVVTGLTIPGDEKPVEHQPITNTAEAADGILYINPSSGPPGEIPGMIQRQPEKTVKPKTSISSKNKDEKQSNPTNSSISDNQNPNDSDNITKTSTLQGKADFLLNMESNMFPTKGPSEEKEPVLARKTIVSYVEGTYKRPVIEIKIPVYNMKETEPYVEENTVYFGEADTPVEQNTVSYMQKRDNKSYIKETETTTATDKCPKTDEMPVSQIKKSEKTPFIEKSPAMNVQINPEYQEMLKNKQKIETANLDTNWSVTGPISNIVDDNTITLKEMLRRIRERHRQEQCQDYYNQLTMTITEACKPKTLGPDPCKRKDKPQCPPPPKCPPATHKNPCDPCAPKKDPCAPKPDPCKPKDPCAKFSFRSGSKILDTICLLNSYFLPGYQSINFQYRRYSSQILSTRILQIHSFNTSLIERKIKGEKIENQSIIFTKDYEPWTPIPSWPIPKKEKKRPVVFPKDGCKLLPPPPFDPAFKDKPCVSFPKKKFCLAELFEHPVLNIIKD